MRKNTNKLRNQAIGHLLQHLVALYKLTDTLKRQMFKLLPQDKK